MTSTVENKQELNTKHLSSKSSLSMLLSAEKNVADSFDEEILYEDAAPSNSSSSSTIGKHQVISFSEDKTQFCCKDLVRTICEGELSKKDAKEDNIFKMQRENVSAETINYADYGLLAAEEDGSPMDDLPEFSDSTNVLAMGIQDFLLIEKKSGEHLMHVRISQQMLHNSSFSNLRANNGSTIEVMRYSRYSRELNKESSLGFEDLELLDEDLENQDSADPTRLNSVESSSKSADFVQMFRTQSEDDQLLAGGHRLMLDMGVLTVGEDEQTPTPPIPSPASCLSTPKTPRGRSASENLTISCRLPGTERWSAPKNIALHLDSPNRVRASTATAIKTKSFTPNRPIPIVNNNSNKESNNGNNDVDRTNGRGMKFYIDTAIDPFQQYKADQEAAKMHRSHSSSLGETDMGAVMVSLNPHTSSSKFVLTPTSRPGSVKLENAHGSSKDGRDDWNKPPKKITTPPKPPSSKSPSPTPTNSSTNAATTTSTTGAASAVICKQTSKELAAYFDKRERTYSSDCNSDDSDEEKGSGKDDFSFFDSSFVPPAPICNLHITTTPPIRGKHFGSGSSNGSVTGKSSGIALEPDEVTACSSGSDYSASDYEAIHAMSVAVNAHLDILNKKAGVNSNHSAKDVAAALADTSSNGANQQQTSPANRNRPADHELSRSRAGSETKRPSFYERIFGSPAVKSKKGFGNSSDAGDTPGRGGRTGSFSFFAKRNSNASQASSNHFGSTSSRDGGEEQEEDGGVCVVRNLDTGDEIELDEDGDGKVTAILIPPDLIYGADH